ncbi:MAG: diguanylate cyclase domain-containing protein [Candidatus Rokuibacteriota bacterium]
MQDLIMSESLGFRSSTARGGWLVDESQFRFLVDFELQKAQRLRYSVAVVCLTASAGSPDSGDVSLASLAEALTRHIRGTDVVAAWTRGLLTLLLIDAEATHLPAIVDRFKVPLEKVAWSAGGSCYPRTATRAEDMLRQAAALLARAQEEGGNRLYVAS